MTESSSYRPCFKFNHVVYHGETLTDTNMSPTMVHNSYLLHRVNTIVSLRALHNHQKVHSSISSKLLAVHDAWGDALLLRGVGTGRLLTERQTSCGSLMSVCCPCDSCSLAAAC